MIILLVAYKGLNILWPFFYDYLDGKWLGHSLRKGEKERVALRETALTQGVQLRGWKPSRMGMFIVMAELAALTITAWVVSPNGQTIAEFRFTLCILWVNDYITLQFQRKPISATVHECNYNSKSNPITSVCTSLQRDNLHTSDPAVHLSVSHLAKALRSMVMITASVEPGVILAVLTKPSSLRGSESPRDA